MEQEEWKDIPGYEGYYQASTFGNIRSVSRVVINSKGIPLHYCSKILRPGKRLKGYLGVVLNVCGNKRAFMVHRLVAITFIGSDKRQIDHGNGIKSDNKPSNLEYVNGRENMNRRYDRVKNTDKHRGVSWSVPSKKWRARISINGKSKHLGVFLSREDASAAYHKALMEIDAG